PQYPLDINGDIRVQGGEIYGINGITGLGNVATGWYSDSSNLAARFPGASGDFYVQSSGAGTTYLRVGAGIGGMRLFSGNAIFDGNVGIGTTAPLDKLDVRGRRALIHVSGNTYDIDGWGKYAVVGEIARENTWPTFLPAGSIGLEASWDSDSLFVGLRDYGWDRKDAIINWGDNTNDNLRIQFNGNDRILITSAGNVGIGTTNPGGYKLYVNGSLYASSYYCASDIRLKRDIQELNGTLEKIMNLHPISFVWNEKSEKAGKKDIGISGQEIEKYFPELVFKNDDGYISVDYSKLSVVAISAIKEQQKIIEEQAQKIKILEEKIKELESKIEKR
ncbi:MAG: tail fiber domain-containing protein, partial [Minisyncoccia bacterium]